MESAWANDYALHRAATKLPNGTFLVSCWSLKSAHLPPVCPYFVICGSRLLRGIEAIGSSSNDGNGKKNVSWKKRNTCATLTIFCNYPILFEFYNVGAEPYNWIGDDIRIMVLNLSFLLCLFARCPRHFVECSYWTCLHNLSHPGKALWPSPSQPSCEHARWTW